MIHTGSKQSRPKFVSAYTGTQSIRSILFEKCFPYSGPVLLSTWKQKQGLRHEFKSWGPRLAKVGEPRPFPFYYSFETTGFTKRCAARPPPPGGVGPEKDCVRLHEWDAPVRAFYFLERNAGPLLAIVLGCSGPICRKGLSLLLIGGRSENLHMKHLFMAKILVLTTEFFPKGCHPNALPK